jgi:hypothetical protein
MPRSNYLRYFKRDKTGNYIGTEDERSWTVEELYQMFGKYSEWGNPRWVMSDDEKGRRIMVAGAKEV